MATDFARFASKDSPNTKKQPFQDLVFLIRDWRHVRTHDFGFKSGTQYVKDILSTSENRSVELLSVREFIYDSFQNIIGFLLPSPGKTVERGYYGKYKETYDGRHSLMDEEFKEHLIDMVETIFAPANLKVKQINGKPISCSEMKEYINMYLELFLSDKTPEADSIYELTVDKNMKILMDGFVVLYKENMFSNIGDPTSTDFAENFEVVHNQAKFYIKTLFDGEKKMGTSKHAKKYKEILEKKFDEAFNELKEHALSNHERFIAEKMKIENSVKDKDGEEKEMAKSLIATREKISKLEFAKRRMDPVKFQLANKELQELLSNQEVKIQDYRIRKENNELFEKVAIIHRESEDRDRQHRKTIEEIENSYEEKQKYLSEQNKKEYQDIQQEFQKTLEENKKNADRANEELKKALSDKERDLQGIQNNLAEIRETGTGFFGFLDALIKNFFNIFGSAFS